MTYKWLKVMFNYIISHYKTVQLLLQYYGHNSKAKKTLVNYPVAQ